MLINNVKSATDRLLYYCPYSTGGLADYAWSQVNALSDLGLDITMLAPASFPFDSSGFPIVHEVIDECKSLNGPKLLRALQRVAHIRQNINHLSLFARRHKFRKIVMASYAEYASPFWSRPLRDLSESGVRFGAILHDPFRDHIVGPRWFHNWSIRSGYSFLAEAFVHEALDRSMAKVPEHVRLSTLPHGPLTFPRAIESGSHLRIRLGIPENAKLLLAFGQIRDGKNLDLVIKSLATFEDLWLLVAGQEAGGTQKSLAHYQQLAIECGVSRRCRWVAGFIPASQVGAFFDASDLILLTYSSRFQSASGVLNSAVQFRRPCLASSGNGPLRTQVERYDLGVWVAPDSERAICSGLQAWLDGLNIPSWSRYLEENSWHRNAAVVIEKMFDRDA